MAFLKGRADAAQPQRWSVALDATLRVSEIAASGAPVPQVISAVVDAATEVLGAEQAVLLLVDEQSKELVVDASAGLPPGCPKGSRIRLSGVLPNGMLPTAAMEVRTSPNGALQTLDPPGRSAATSVLAPLRVGGKVEGLLYIPSFKPSDVFEPDDLRLAQMFADQVAGVLQRTRLHEKAEQRSSGLTALVECTKGLLDSLDMEALLHSILDGATRLSHADGGFICLFDPETGAVSRGVFRNIAKTEIRAITEAPSVKQAMDEQIMILIPNPMGSRLAIGLRTTRGTKALIVVPGDQDLIDERSYVLRAFAQQCASALGASELHSEIERKESQLSSLIMSVPNPIVLVDHQRRIVSMNPAAERLFQTSAAFAMGQSISTTIPHPEIKEFLEGDGMLSGEITIGTPLSHFKVRVTDVRMPGAPLGRLLIMDDITQEREMAQTQRDFVAMIGHELRTPLTVIKGFAKMMYRKIDQVSKEDLKDALNTIDHRAELLERLIEDLLYVGQIESRETSLKLEETEINDLIQGVAVDVLEGYPQRTVDIEVPPSLRWACDEAKVGIVLRHLVDNALKYSPEGTPVTIKARTSDDELRIDVIDKGQGIVSSDIPHIFERFKQVDGSATREHGGTGVGLYLSAQLMKLHGGRIWVDSTWGKGSTFSLTLPLASVQPDVVTLQARRDIS